ncbi:MAG: hypothetical protein EA392_07040 [Cryomorphaceae bacterium]|nr:MAG: hypothetical protein EA392_07040 [Cryomorphaceae bacterium]
METPVFIIGLGLLIFGAHFFNRIFSFTRIPNALLFILFGIVIGPVLKLVSPDDFGKMGPVFSAVTLILLLYESGTNLSIRNSNKAFVPSVMFTASNFVASATVATIVALLFFPELELIAAVFFGAICGGTSSAIVIPMLKQIKTDQTSSTYLILESAISDVLCLVVGLAIFDAMALGKVDFGTISLKILKAFFLASLIGLVSGYLWSISLNLIRELQNHILINLGVLFIIYGTSEYFNLNGGIASLTFGFALANSYLLPSKKLGSRWIPKPLLREEKLLFSELVFVFATFFFVYIGLNIVFAYPIVYIASSIIILLILVLRPWSTKFTIPTQHSVRDLGMMSVMAPKGIVPAILAALPLQLGLERNNEFLVVQGQIIQNLTFSIILLSIVICSALVIHISSRKDGMWYMKTFFAKKIKTESDAGDDDGSNDPAHELLDEMLNRQEATSDSKPDLSEGGSTASTEPEK